MIYTSIFMEKYLSDQTLGLQMLNGQKSLLVSTFSEQFKPFLHYHMFTYTHIELYRILHTYIIQREITIII